MFNIINNNIINLHFFEVYKSGIRSTNPCRYFSLYSSSFLLFRINTWFADSFEKKHFFACFHKNLAFQIFNLNSAVGCCNDPL